MGAIFSSIVRTFAVKVFSKCCNNCKCVDCQCTGDIHIIEIMNYVGYDPNQTAQQNYVIDLYAREDV